MIPVLKRHLGKELCMEVIDPLYNKMVFNGLYKALFQPKDVSTNFNYISNDFKKKARILTIRAKVVARGQISNLITPDLREVLMFSIVA